MSRIFSIAFLIVAMALSAASSPRADEPPAGKVPYERVCKVCHAEEGKGGAGPALIPMERDVDEVKAIVREGTGQMPPVSEQRLSDEEIAAIVGYLKSLGPASR